MTGAIDLDRPRTPRNGGSLSGKEMKAVFINTTGESFTARKSGAIGTWLWEVCQAASRAGAEPMVISGSADAEPYPWANAIFVRYPYHDFNIGWKRAIRKVLVLQTRIGGWYHIRHAAWCKRVGDAIASAGLEKLPLILNNDLQLAVMLRRRFPKAFIMHIAHNQNQVAARFRTAFGGAVNVAVAVSDFSAKWNSEFFGIDVKTVHSGVDSGRFRPAEITPPGPVYLNFVGRTVSEKGPDILLRAALKLAERHGNFGVQIIGAAFLDGHEHTDCYQVELETMIHDLKQKGVNVRTTGFVDRHMIPDELRKAHIHVVPARWDEAFGLATLEGMASGLATVAARTGGTPEVVGNGGLLFERESVDGLVAHLDRLLSDEAVRRDYARRARARAEELTWDHTWAGISDMLPS